jgi:hypothetical protein
MTSDEEGLDLEEILDDVEVPTAAHAIVVAKGDNVYDIGEIISVGKGEPFNLEPWNEKIKLVRREDHEEALEEAVQQAREQERRRILNKIEELKTDLEEENLEGRLIWGVANQNQRKTAINTVKE